MEREARETAQLSCSGLVAESTAGAVLHVAHMDQAPDSVRNVTLQVTFKRAGQVVLESVDWYWFTSGVTRVVRKGVASAQENWRTTGVLAAADVLRDIAAGAVPHVFAFRAVLAPEDERTAARSFDEATLAWTSQFFAAPEYIIAAGPATGDGMVIARNPNASQNPPLGVLHLNETDDGWFFAQSNYDHWEKDNEIDPRRSAAEHLFREFGRDAATTPVGMYAIASAWPVHNPKTVYTAVMSPATGELHAYVRRAMCPEKRDMNWPFVSGFANGVHYKCNMTGK